MNFSESTLTWYCQFLNTPLVSALEHFRTFHNVTELYYEINSKISKIPSCLSVLIVLNAIKGT